MVKPIIEPVIISLIVCLFNVNLAHAIRIVNAIKSNPIVKFIGIIKKDKKIFNETCNEFLIK